MSMREMRGMRGSDRRGFALVELLVVIGIIAILISILLPSLSRARAASQTVACASQLRQIYQFYSLYALDFHGYYPALSGFHGWSGEVASDFDQRDDGVCVMQRYQAQDGNAHKQQLWLCPAESETTGISPWGDTGGHSPYPINDDLRQVSYGENSVAWKSVNPAPANWWDDHRDRRAIKADRIRSPKFAKSDVVMLAERRSINPVFYQNAPWQNSFMVEGGRTTDTWDGLLYRHYADYSMMNALYFDGHVSALNYRDCQSDFASMLTWPNPFE